MGRAGAEISRCVGSREEGDRLRGPRLGCRADDRDAAARRAEDSASMGAARRLRGIRSEMKAERILDLALRLGLGGLFIYAGVAKLGDLQQFFLDVHHFELTPWDVSVG